MNSTDLAFEDLKQDCYKKDEFNSCYKLGEYYLNQNKKDNGNNKENLVKASIYFSEGCRSFYTEEILFRKSGFKENINCCIKEAEILKTSNDVKNSDFEKGNKFKKVADYYFNKNDLKKAYEYYIASLDNGLNDKDTYYNLSQILLEGKQIPQNIELSKRYFIKYIQYETANIFDKNLKIYKLFKNMHPLKINLKIELANDGTILNSNIITSTNDKNFNLKVDEIKEYKFFPIPKEYEIKQLVIPEIQYVLDKR